MKLKYFIPSFLMMTIIFFFSSQTGNDSSELSNAILLWIQNTLNITIPSLLIRKLAHMFEYALLMFTFMYGFKKNNIKHYMIYALFCSFLYACSDEFHQLFIENRSGNFIDVCIDTFGAFIVLIISKIKKSYIHQ